MFFHEIAGHELYQYTYVQLEVIDYIKSIVNQKLKVAIFLCISGVCLRTYRIQDKTPTTGENYKSCLHAVYYAPVALSKLTSHHIPKCNITSSLTHRRNQKQE